MTEFGFLAPARTRMGRGQAPEAVGDIAALGTRVLLVRGRSVAFADELADRLAGAGAAVHPLYVTGEPTLPDLETALQAARAFGADSVVALGGGSVIDLGKAVAALCPAAYGPLRYLEGVGEAQPLDAAPLPFTAIPTTSGTGAEATRNAVIGVPEAGRKVSLRDARMVPLLAIVDPALTDGCPKAVTLASGLDAVTQVIEPYLSSRANPVTDALCESAIGPGMKALARLMEHEDAHARDTLSRVSHFGGLALANSGLGAVHGLAGVLGGETGGAHGAICGRLLAPVLVANKRAVAAAGGDIERFDRVDRWIADALPALDGTAPERLARFADMNGLPRLRDMGLDPARMPDIAETSAGASSMKANPVPLPSKVLESILDSAL